MILTFSDSSTVVTNSEKLPSFEDMFLEAARTHKYVGLPELRQLAIDFELNLTETYVYYMHKLMTGSKLPLLVATSLILEDEDVGQ